MPVIGREVRAALAIPRPKANFKCARFLATAPPLIQSITTRSIRLMVTWYPASRVPSTLPTSAPSLVTCRICSSTSRKSDVEKPVANWLNTTGEHSPSEASAALR